MVDPPLPFVYPCQPSPCPEAERILGSVQTTIEATELRLGGLIGTYHHEAVTKVEAKDAELVALRALNVSLESRVRDLEGNEPTMVSEIERASALGQAAIKLGANTAAEHAVTRATVEAWTTRIVVRKGRKQWAAALAALVVAVASLVTAAAQWRPAHATTSTVTQAR